MADTPQIPSTKPYLVRAIYEWCTDNGFTPFVAVAVDAATRVPREHVRDGQIVLNLGVEATGKLLIDNDGISAVARFGGVARDLYLPMANVSAIYARENGAGMGFEVASADDAENPAAPDLPETAAAVAEPSAEPAGTPGKGGRSHLQRIK